MVEGISLEALIRSTQRKFSRARGLPAATINGARIKVGEQTFIAHCTAGVSGIKIYLSLVDDNAGAQERSAT